MSSMAEQVAHMVDMLPDSEQLFAFEFVKRLMLAWDPDFTKVTPQEAEALRLAGAEIARGETVSMEDVNWN